MFVYGSLRKGFHSPAYEYISRYFRFSADGKVKGKLYDLGSYPAALPTTEQAYIIGELYEIQDPAEFAWAMGQLDDYEGLNVEAGEEQLYRRELTEVLLEDGREIRAWIYWYNADVSGKPVVASGDIVDYIRNRK